MPSSVPGWAPRIGRWRTGTEIARDFVLAERRRMALSCVRHLRRGARSGPFGGAGWDRGGERALGRWDGPAPAYRSASRGSQVAGDDGDAPGPLVDLLGRQVRRALLGVVDHGRGQEGLPALGVDEVPGRGVDDGGVGV